MDTLLNWIIANQIAGAVLIIAFSLVVIAIVLMYVIAFFQGRSISFWPPKIGERLITNATEKAKRLDERTHPQSKASDGIEVGVDRVNEVQPPEVILKKGAKVMAASGKIFSIQSDFYSGATATLYRALSPENIEVVLKMYWRGLKPLSPAWEQFSREYHSAELLQHRNIIKVLDRGLNTGYPFVVMEWMRGGTLRDLILERHRIPGSQIFSVMTQVAEAIDYAHRIGVLHRDIKPGNILFDSDANGRAVLSDFGIAQIFGAVERDITAQGGEFVGTPGYIAPESFEGREYSPAADIYSFGVVLFELIAGKIPFDQFASTYAVLQAKISRDAPSITEFRSDVSKRLAERIAATLSRNPMERPRTARAVLSGVETYIQKL